MSKVRLGLLERSERKVLEAGKLEWGRNNLCRHEWLVYTMKLLIRGDEPRDPQKAKAGKNS